MGVNNGEGVEVVLGFRPFLEYFVEMGGFGVITPARDVSLHRLSLYQLITDVVQESGPVEGLSL